MNLLLALLLYYWHLLLALLYCVQMTAASFTKSFLGLEGELTPILVSLVSKDQKASSKASSKASRNPYPSATRVQGPAG